MEMCEIELIEIIDGVKLLGFFKKHDNGLFECEIEKTGIKTVSDSKEKCVEVLKNIYIESINIDLDKELIDLGIARST